jgi:hypothetical protein
VDCERIFVVDHGQELPTGTEQVRDVEWLEFELEAELALLGL